MAKKIGVAYVPTSTDIPATAPQKIDTPDYPDAGTAYAGFSKTLLSGNTYKLNPQELYDFNINYTLAAGNNNINIGPLTKDLYVTKIVFQSYNNAAVSSNDTIEIKSGGTVKFAMHELQPDLTNNILIDLDFVTPVKFEKEQLIKITFSNGRNVSNFVSINLYGWIE